MDGDRIGLTHAQQKIRGKRYIWVHLLRMATPSCAPLLWSLLSFFFLFLHCIFVLMFDQIIHVRRCTARLVQKMNTEPNSSTTPYLRILVQNTCRLGFRVLYFFSPNYDHLYIKHYFDQQCKIDIIRFTRKIILPKKLSNYVVFFEMSYFHCHRNHYLFTLYWQACILNRMIVYHAFMSV